MQIRLDQVAKTAPYEQIKASIIAGIGSGALQRNHRLPSIRQLAGDLGVAPNTVARAYRELESEGYLRSRGRRGTTVIGRPEPVMTADRALDRAVADARRRGLDGPTILAIVSQALARP
jgi:DNA-binding transcriptional regulator YhcF (GntR family)